MSCGSDQFILKTFEDRLCAMVNKTQLLLLVIAVASCHGQLADYLFPGISNSVRRFSNVFVNQPVVKFGSQTTGNVFNNIVSGLSTVPFAVARSLIPSSRLPIPNLFNDKNVVDSTDTIVADFTAGLPNTDATLQFQELITKYGYPLAKYKVVTEDGYILKLFRIPGNGSVVFLMHGLLGSADDYIIAGPESGLAYLLANEGYDVWMGNARGNKHSRRHVEMQPSDAAFWDFSWHEIGFYDLPAMIDYILHETGQESLKYIGHSQGTTSFFVMTSTKPEYNKKISVMVALSPVAFMSHASSPIVRLLAPTNRLVHGFFKLIGAHEFLPDNSLMRGLKQLMCGIGPVAEILCSNMLFLIAGAGFDQLNVTNLPVIYGHVPSGAAAKQFVHYAQGAVSGEFRKFDYGPEENMWRYGSGIPPDYKLNEVICPVSLFYSDADWLSHPTDVDTLYNRLGNAIDIYKVPFKPFNHLDFLWAKDFNNLIFKRLRKLLPHF